MNKAELKQYIGFMYHKPYEGSCKRLYFASEASGSIEYGEVLDAGEIPPEADYYQLQRNDALVSELGITLEFSDNDAVMLAKADAARGCKYAQEQLRLARYDRLVNKTDLPEELK